MGYIRNREALCDHGNVAAREALVDIVEGALDAVQPDRLLDDRLTLRGDVLTVDGVTYDLAAVEDVYLVAAGKGSAALASAVVDRLGDRIADGIVVEKHGQGVEIDGLQVLEAGHPVPDDAGVAAAERVTALARAAGEGDLVIAGITGGASALLPAPAGDVSLADKIAITRELLDAGAPVEDLNAVRKHLSTLKGGRLAELIRPAAAVSLIVVDEVGGAPWGPTVPDETTFDDAVAALERHGAWDGAPASVRTHLRRGLAGAEPETPTAATFEAHAAQTVAVADAADVCEAACDRASDLGYEPLLLSTMIEGESRGVGTCLAGIAREAAASGRPVEPPCALVSGGETTVTVENGGEGGPNQELAVAVALAVAGSDRITAAAVDTDGTDGPTAVAGGIVDGHTAARAADRGVDLAAGLRAHESTAALGALGDALRTGPTGTNLMDLRVVLVDESEDGDPRSRAPSDRSGETET